MKIKHISIKKTKEIAILRENGQVLHTLKAKIRKMIKPGIKLIELDKFAFNYIGQAKGKPSFLNYHGFPNSICTSVNDILIHGIPNEYSLKEGDLISIDLGFYKNGFHVDSAFSMVAGKDTSENKVASKLINCAEEALKNCLSVLRPNNDLNLIGKAIEQIIFKNNFFTTKDFCGHGIGKNLHEEPMILNYYTSKYNIALASGMVLAIEPMVLATTKDTFIDLDDHWSIKSADGCLTAHHEETILVTDTGYEILT